MDYVEFKEDIAFSERRERGKVSLKKKPRRTRR